MKCTLPFKDAPRRGHSKLSKDNVCTVSHMSYLRGKYIILKHISTK